mgnify:FL=1
MNDQTAMASYIFAAFVAVVIGVGIRRMVVGWRRRGERQEQLIGQLPALPDTLGAATIAPTHGLYVGSTLASNKLERIVAGDFGYRAKAILTRYPQGILLQRSGAGPIWMPSESITEVRTECFVAGKAIPARSKDDWAEGVLAIRWRLPSGTEIDTGFRGDDRRDHARWTGEQA